MPSRIRTSLFAVAALAAVAACDKSSGSASGPESAAPSASSSAPVVASAPPSAAPSADASSTAVPAYDKGRGLTAVFVRAAALLPGLNDSQTQTLHALDDRLAPPDPDPMRAEMRGLHQDLLAGVRAGKIDAAKIAAHYAALDQAAQKRTEIEGAALNDLYAALDPAQRKGVTTMVRAKRAAVGRDTRRHADAGAPDAAVVDPAKRRLEAMTRDLALDPGQKAAVAALLAKLPSPDAADAAETQRMAPLLAAFERDGFDAKRFDLGVVPGKKPHDAIAPHVDLVTRLVAILLPDQRLRLAASLAKQRGAIGGVGAHDED